MFMMWIVSSSDSHAVAARDSEIRRAYQFFGFGQIGKILLFLSWLEHHCRHQVSIRFQFN